MELEDEVVDILDEDNQVIGQSTRKEAHVKGHIHRALSVLVLNSKGQLLLQRRSKNKSVHALAWDLSTSEHVLAGETYEQAGVRSVKEELGVKAVVKRATQTAYQKRQYRVGDKTVYENEIVLMLTAEHEGPFEIDPNEVHEVKFFEVEEVELMVKNREDFTIWFLEEWESVKRVISQLSSS